MPLLLLNSPIVKKLDRAMRGFGGEVPVSVCVCVVGSITPFCIFIQPTLLCFVRFHYSQEGEEQGTAVWLQS